jgi:hypothetical protein
VPLILRDYFIIPNETRSEDTRYETMSSKERTLITAIRMRQLRSKLSSDLGLGEIPE